LAATGFFYRPFGELLFLPAYFYNFSFGLFGDFLIYRGMVTCWQYVHYPI